MSTAARGQHEHRGVRAVQRLVEYAPATGGLALWVRHRDVDDDDEALPPPQARTGAAVAPVCTDGRTLFYTPAFERLSIESQAGAVARSVLHVALRHAQRAVALRARLGDVDGRLFNIAASAIVDSALSHLGWLELPAQSVRLEQLLVEAVGERVQPETALLNWDVERLYLALDDREPPDRGGRRRDGPRSRRARELGAQNAADLREPQPNAPRDESERDPDGTAQAFDTEREDEAAMSREWGERLRRAHAGDGAFSLLRVLLADIPRVRTPWEQVLRAQGARALAQRPTLSWSRPSRSWLAHRGWIGPKGRPGGHRMPWEPGIVGSTAVPRLAIVIDVSGSVDDTLLQRFARELRALTRRLGARCTIVIGDDQVRRVEHYEPGRTRLEGIDFSGAGGTDFEPLIAEALEHRPDLIVLLTDLDGPAGPKPPVPVLWAVPPAFAGAAAPFGRKLVLE